ncbi:MAG: RND transporter [Deltaproteobacteria bacterium RIFOXYD12_FULL_57_12]|nr:MAG: RND transporter [Deltaproteobacteria bacterium RIFOXYD12_FULL_57_12]
MEKFLDSLPWALLLVACFTLGLAPFTPPHLFEKLQMLARGRLVRPLDWFDLLLHATPWLLLLLKGFYSLRRL